MRNVLFLTLCSAATARSPPPSPLYYLLQQFGISVASPRTEHLEPEIPDEYDENSPYGLLERDPDYDEITYIDDDDVQPLDIFDPDDLSLSFFEMEDIPANLRPYYDKYDPSYIGEDDSRYKGQGEFEADPPARHIQIQAPPILKARRFRGRPGEPDTVPLEDDPIIRLTDPVIDVHDDRRVEVQGPFDNCFHHFHSWTVQFQKTYHNDDAYNNAHTQFKLNKAIVDEHNAAYERGETTFKMELNKFSDLDEEARNQALYPMHTVRASPPPSKELPKDLWTLFHHWTVKHTRIYQTAQHIMDRFHNWKSNHAFILEHNNADHSFTLAHNHLSDTTQEERLQHLMKFPMPKKSEDTPVATWLEHVDPNIVPDNIDWRDMGAVTPVKDQGRCGSCWAFSAISTLESQVAIKTGVQQTLSVEELVACENKVSNGCDGGMYNPAWEFVKEHGIVTEDAWPYASADGVTGECFPEKMKDPFLRTISGITDVPPFREELMVNALAKVGPISIAIDAGSQSFSFYADGIYDESPRLITLNHAVQIVGYTEDAWILRNSWATGWGKDGYMLLARNTGKRKGVLGEVVTPAFVVL